MFKKLILGVASSLLMMGAANAATVVSNGSDDIGAVAPTLPANAVSILTGAGIAVGGTDVAAVNNAAANRFFTTSSAGNLIIQVNSFLAGNANDFLIVGNTDTATSLGDLLALSVGTPSALAAGNTITIPLSNAAIAASIAANGFFDVIVLDDTDVDFFELALTAAPAIPVPAALPLMASALIGGSVAARRRRKTQA